MTTLELAKKLDQCLAAQVKLQEERDVLHEALKRLLIVAGEGTSKGRALDLLPPGTVEKARAALAQVSTSRV